MREVLLHAGPPEVALKKRVGLARAEVCETLVVGAADGDALGRGHDVAPHG